MRLTVIIPAYNEIRTIPELVRRIAAVPVEKELILVDNASTDGTREWIQNYPSPAKKILHERNQGKGSSVRDGLAAAEGDIAIIQDADLEYDPQEIPGLMEPIERGEAEVVFGSRELGGKKAGTLGIAIGRYFLNSLTNVLFAGSLTDVATCYKLINRRVYRSLRLTTSGFELDFEIAARILKTGATIIERPISYRPRTEAEGKKIRLHHGWACLWTLLRVRFDRD